MVHRVLVLLAFVCCALVIASFGLFARDQVAGASTHQQNELVAGSPAKPPAAPAQAPAQHQPGQPRRFIDGAAKTLTSPFRSIVQSDNGWVAHGLPTVVALVVYGLGLGYLARFSRGLS